MTKRVRKRKQLRSSILLQVLSKFLDRKGFQSLLSTCTTLYQKETKITDSNLSAARPAALCHRVSMALQDLLKKGQL